MRRRFSLLGLITAIIVAGCGGSSHQTHTAKTHQAKPQGHQITNLQAIKLGANPRGNTPTYVTPYGVSAHSPTFGLHPKNVPLPAPLSRTESAQTITMLDSVDSNLSIFSGLNPLAVAGYTHGSWPTYWNYAGHFKYVVAVMVQSYYFGVKGAANNCLDVEPGDATPSEAGPWAVKEQGMGFIPCVYGSLSEFPAINGSLSASHIGKAFRWCADWTFYAHLTSGCDATQWTDHYSGRNIDGSVVTTGFVGNNAPPPPPRVICWGKGSTPKSSECLKIEAQAKHNWQQYLAFHNGQLRHQKQLNVVKPYPGYYEQNKPTISVPAYKGPSIGYLNGRISEEIKNAAHFKTLHDTEVKDHHA